MRAQWKENEPPCEGCKYYIRAKQRELKQFLDGKNYMATGTCANPQSRLHERELSGSMTASRNALHNRRATIAETLGCFVAP